MKIKSMLMTTGYARGTKYTYKLYKITKNETVYAYKYETYYTGTTGQKLLNTLKMAQNRHTVKIVEVK